MEKLNVYSIYDLKSEIFSSPIVDSKGSFTDYMKFIINDSKSEWSKFSGDFIVYELGTFDSITGLINLHDDKKILCSLSDYKLPKEA